MTTSEDSGRTSQGDEPISRKPRKHRRRWLVVLAIVVIVLAVAVALAPAVLSSDMARGILVGAVNEDIRGSLSIGDIKLSWRGPMHVENLRARDPEDREVLNVERFTYAGGLLRAAFDAKRFETVSVVSPHVTLHLDAKGKPSIERAFESLKGKSDRKDKPKRPKRGPPKAAVIAAVVYPEGKLTVSDGLVKVVHPDGRTYELSGIDADISVTMAGQLEGEIDFQTTGGGDLDISFETRLTSTEGEAQGATGRIAIITRNPLPLAPIGQFAGSSSAIDGAATINVNWALAGENMRGNFALGVDGLQSGGMERPKIRPIDLKLAGEVQADAADVSGQMDLTGGAGNLHAEFSYDRCEQADLPSTKDFLAKVFGGQSVAMPEFALDVNGQIDIPSLARAVPALLNILPTADITSGKLLAESISVRGGREPSVECRVALQDLTARVGDRTITPQPISLATKVVLEDQTGLKVQDARLKSAFCGATGSGTTSDMTGTFWLDLAKFHRDLGQILNLGEVAPQGRIDGSMKLTRNEADRIDAAGSVTGVNLNYQTAAGPVRIDRAAASHEGYVTLRDNKPTEFVLTKGEFNLADALSAGATGRYDVETGSLRGKLDVTRADLQRLNESFAPAGLPKYSGLLTLTASLQRASSEEPITSSGSGKVRDFRPADEPGQGQAVEVAWSGLAIHPADRKLDLDSLTLKSNSADLSITQLELLGLADLQARGNAKLSVDIADFLAAIAPAAGWETPPQIAGQLSWTGTAESSGGRVNLSGSGDIKDLLVQDNGRSFRQDTVTFAQQAELDARGDKLTLKKLDLSSEILWIKMAGNITKLRTQRILDLTGSYGGSWEHITILLHQLAPDTRGNIAMTGQTGGEISIAGPASRPEVRPAFRGVTAKTPVGWAGAEVLGLTLAETKFSPTLSDGRINIPKTTIDASGGKIRLAGTVDLTDPQPVYRLPDEVTLIEDLAIDQKVAREFLSRLNPIFAHLAGAEGSLSLTTRNLELPLGEQIKHAGTGSGHVDLSKLKVLPSGILTELLRLGGLTSAGKLPVKVPGVDFILRDGRIHYDNFALVFPGGYDLRFYGSVGFDNTVDLTISMPITPRLLERFGVKGPVIDYVRVLEGARVDIPLRGTRLGDLRLGKVDLGGLIEREAKLLLSEELTKTIQDILKGPASNAPQPDEKKPKDEDTIKDGNSAPNPLLDLFRDLLDSNDANAPNQLP